jgi:hypothetical protein
VTEATAVAAGALLLLGAVAVFALSVRVGILVGRRMDRVLEARQAADGIPSDQKPDVVDEVGVDD